MIIARKAGRTKPMSPKAGVTKDRKSSQCFILQIKSTWNR